MRALTAAPGAHRTGLDRGVEGAVFEAPAADLVRRLAEGLDLGVVGRVGQALPAVAPASDHLAVPDDHRPDRHLLLGEGDPGERQRLGHEVAVVGGERQGR